MVGQMSRIKEARAIKKCVCSKKKSRANQVMEAQSKGEQIALMKLENLKNENPWLSEKLEEKSY